MKKSLVILAGIPRGGIETWESIYKNLVQSENADLALCTEKNFILDIDLKRKAKYLWLFDGYDDWKDYYVENNLSHALNYLALGKDTGLYNSGIIVFALKDIIKRNYLEILENYDQVFFSRFDQLHTIEHPHLSKENVWFVEGEDYGGINDRHFAFPAKDSKYILDICNYINTKKALDEIPELMNCESVWLRHLENIGMMSNAKRFKRTQFTVSYKGDFTRWRVARYNLFLFKNLKIKYPSEFLIAMKNTVTELGLIKSCYLIPRLTLNYYFLRIRKIISVFLPKPLKAFFKKILNIY
jgi:hypothetical protein